MAFPTYPYPGYTPAYYPQPVPDQLAQLRQNQMQQQMMQAQAMPQQVQPQPMQPQMTPGVPQNNGIIWVSSKQEADSYLIAPGSAVALWDSNNPVIYLRQADSTGKPSTKVYDLVERIENRPAQQQASQIDLTQFITKDNLSQFITRDELEDILAERLKRPSKATKQKEDTDNG